MSPEVVEDFRTTGTSHLLAISGLHVGVLLVLSLGAASWWFGRRRHLYLLLPLACICFYALVSGLPASVVRAAIMGSIYLAALALGRPRSALPALAFAAAVMAAINPRVLEQVSFQLSFAAMAGIVLALPVVAGLSQTVTTRLNTTMGWWQRWLIYLSGWVLGALVVSVAATLATLPLIAFNFHQIPLLGILVTVLALPALPFILVGTLATALAGLVHPALGQFFGWLTWGPLSYLLGLVALAPGKTVSGAWAGAPLVWAWYIVLGGALLVPGSLTYLKGLPGRFATSVWHPALGSLAASRPTGLTLGFLGLALVLAVAGMFLWVQVFSGPDGKLHVYFFDVGQGDSTLIVTPNGRQVLVDGGPDAESATRALVGPLSRWDRSLDLVALTHPDTDHGRGLLEVLDRYEVAGVLVGVEAPESPLYPQWQATLDRQGLTAIPVSSGYRIILEEDVTLEVLNPPPTSFQGSPSDRNNNGVVFRLVYGEVSFMLAADIESLVENYLVRQGRPLESVVLKVPHHGSNTSTTAEFLRRVNPSQAVISSGEDNPFGHPRPQVLARLEDTLGQGGVYQTAQQGDVEFISDGRRLWVRTQR